MSSSSGARQRSANFRQESDRKEGFNQQVEAAAGQLQGNIGLNPEFDFEQLKLQGTSPQSSRDARLQALINIFTNRQQEVQQQRFEPGASQTRLSMVD